MQLRRELPRCEARERDPQTRCRVLRAENVLPKMIYTFITEQCPDLPVTTCCRVLKVSTSGFYQRLKQPVTDTELAEAYAANGRARHLGWVATVLRFTEGPPGAAPRPGHPPLQDDM